MKKSKLGKDIVILLVFTLITVITWIAFTVWSTAHKNTIPKTTMEQMTPLNPKINKEIFESLKTKTSFSEEEMSVIQKIPASTPSAELEPTSTEQLEPTPIATESSQTSTESVILEE